MTPRLIQRTRFRGFEQRRLGSGSGGSLQATGALSVTGLDVQAPLMCLIYIYTYIITLYEIYTPDYMAIWSLCIYMYEYLFSIKLFCSYVADIG